MECHEAGMESTPVTNDAAGQPMSATNKVLTTGAAATQVSEATNEPPREWLSADETDKIRTLRP